MRVEVLKVIDVVDNRGVCALFNALVELVKHALVDGVALLLLAKLAHIVLWLFRVVVLGFLEHLAELLEALDVSLDHVELLKAFVLVKDGRRTVGFVRALWLALTYEVNFVALGLV